MVVLPTPLGPYIHNIRTSLDPISNCNMMDSTREFIPTRYLATYNGIRFNLEFEISSTISWINSNSVQLSFTKHTRHVNS